MSTKNLKPIKWLIHLFHNYENKEYKERHQQDTSFEIFTINVLSNIINDSSLFTKEEKKFILDSIFQFHISEVEKQAFLKIIQTPYPMQTFKNIIYSLPEKKKLEIFFSISDIFITKYNLTQNEELFLTNLFSFLQIDNQSYSSCIHEIKKSYKKLKDFLLCSKNLKNEKTKKDLLFASFTNLNIVQPEALSLFEKNEIVNCIIFTASILSINNLEPKFLMLLWVPQILLKGELNKAINLISKVNIIYTKYEKIVAWNVINVKKLLKKSSGTEKLLAASLIRTSIDFTIKLISHDFKNNEHKKISKFQRSIKN